MTEAVLVVRITPDNRLLSAAIRQANGELTQLGQTGERVGQSTARGGQAGARAMQETAAAAREARRETGLLADAAGDLRSRMIAAASIAGLAVLGRQLGQTADAYTNLSSKIGLVSESEQAANRVRREVLGLAQLTRQDLAATGELYVRLTRATESLGLAESQRLRITETINKAMVVSGASAQEASAAIIQLSQGLASGALRGEEFNSVSEQAPILLDLLGRSLGKTRGELREMAADGLITAEVLTGALLEGSAEVDRQFAGMALTLGGASTALGNAFTAYIGSANEAAGVSRAVAAAVFGVAENFELIANVVLGAATAFAVRYVAGVAASVVAKRQAAAAAVTLAEATLAEARAAEVAAASQVKHAVTLNGTRVATDALAAAQARTAAATAALTTAQAASVGVFARMGGALSALVGGPLGLLAIGLGAAAAATWTAIEAEEARRAEFAEGIGAINSAVEANRQLAEAMRSVAASAPPPIGERVAQQASATELLAEKQRELAEAQRILNGYLLSEFGIRAQLSTLQERMATAPDTISPFLRAAYQEVQELQAANDRLRASVAELAKVNQEALAPAIDATRARLAELNAESQAGGFAGMLAIARNAAEALGAGLEVGQAMQQSYRQAQAIAGTLAADGEKAQQALGEVGKTAAQVAQQQVAAWEAAARASGAFTEEQIAAERARLAAAAESVAAFEKAQAASRSRGTRDQEAAREAAKAMREVDKQVRSVAQGSAALQRVLDRQSAHLGGPTVAAWQRYQAELREISEAEARMAELGPLRIEEVRELEQARRQAAESYKKDLEEIEKAEDTQAQALEQLLASIEDTGINRLLADIKLVEEALESATDPKTIERLTNAMGVLQGALGDVGEATRAAFIQNTQQGLRSLQSMTENGSKAFAAMQVAIDALSVAQAISAVLNQAQGDPYTAFARMAAMAAAVAQLVGNIGANFGGSNGFTDTAAERQRTQGTGTVLGDAEADSESIANATKITADATSELVGISRGMLRALTRLQAGVDAAGGMLARGAGQAEFQGVPGSFAFSDNFLGGALSPLAYRALDPLNILGGSQRVTDQGIAISGSSLSDIGVSAYQEQQYRRWRFGSRRTREEFQPVGEEFQAQFQLIVDSLVETVRQGALALGLLPDEIQAALDAFQLETIRISLKDLSAEEQQAELQAVLSSLFDGIAGDVVPFLGQFQRLGEGLGETLVRVATGVQVTREALDRLGFSLESTGVEQFAQISESLIELSGGLEEFISGMASFVDAFAPEARKFELLQTDLNRTLAEAGLVLPRTREGMWALMQSMDATTESGREQIATLLRVAGLADAYYQQLERQQQDQARALQDQIAAVLSYEAEAQALRDEVSEAGLSAFAIELRNINRWSEDARDSLNEAARAAGFQAAAEEDLAAIHQIAAQRAAAAIARLRESARDLVADLYGSPLDRIQEEIERIERAQQDAAQSQIDGINAVGDAAEDVYAAQLSALQEIKAWLDSQLLGDLSTLTPEQQLAEARRQFEATLEAARGGDTEALGRITGQADALLRLGREYWASGDPYTELEGFIRGALGGLVAAGPTASPLGPSGGSVGGGGSTGIAVSPELQALYEERDALAARQEAERREAILAELGRMIRELIQATGEPLAEVASSIGLNLRDLAGDLGLELDNLTTETALGLVNMARSLGVDVAELAENIGVSLGSLADRQSLLNEALDETLGRVPAEFREQLRAPLDAIRSATTEADATAAVEDAEAAINAMPASVRDLLAPFFADIKPTAVVTELGTLRDISAASQEQLTVLRGILAALSTPEFQAIANGSTRPENGATGSPPIGGGLPGSGGVPIAPIPPDPNGGLASGAPPAGFGAATVGDESAVVAEIRAMREASDRNERAMLDRLERLEAAQRDGSERIAAEQRRATEAAMLRR